METNSNARDFPEVKTEELPRKGEPEPTLEERAHPTVTRRDGGSAEGAVPRMTELSASIAAAEDRSDILARAPALAGYRGVIRKLAALAVTVVTRLSRFLIDRQIDFNRTVTQGLRHMSRTVEDLSQTVEDLSRTVEALRYEQRSIVSQVLYLKSTLDRQGRRVDASPGSTQGHGEDSFREHRNADTVQENPHALDALYATFQDRFRGSREDIKMRLRAHLPRVRATGAGTDTMPIIDLGCGRGEWLELLREEGLRARGVDLNRISIAGCRDIGLEVAEQDALSYLRSLSEMDVGAVTGFHLIEHMPFDVLWELLGETYRVLKPGGLAIFETPNPQNVLVGSCTFYLDPTHRNPLPAGLVQFMMEIRGFSKIEVVPLHPYPEAARIHGSELADRFSDHFYGPQDYAVAGRRL